MGMPDYVVLQNRDFTIEGALWAGGRHTMTLVVSGDVRDRFGGRFMHRAHPQLPGFWLMNFPVVTEVGQKGPSPASGALW